MGLEAQPGEIQIVNEDINHSNGVVLGDIIIQSFGKQGCLMAIGPLNKSTHP